MMKLRGQFNKLALFILLLGLPCAGALAADTIAELKAADKKAAELLNQGKKQEALPYLQKLVKLSEQAFGKDDPIYVQYVYSLGATQLQLNDYKNAEPNLKQALKPREKILKTEPQDYADVVIRLASAYNHTGRAPEAATLCDAALQALKRAGVPKGIPYAEIAAYFALAYIGKGEFDKAEPFAKEAVEILKKSASDKDFITAVDILWDFGKAYRDVKQKVAAQKYLSDAVELYLSKGGKKDIYYAEMLSDYADMTVLVGEHSKAEKVIGEVVALMEKLEGQNNIYTIKCMGEMGYIYMMSGQYSKADEVLEKAEERLRKSHGTENACYETIASHRGRVCYDLGMYEKAEKYYQDALRLAKKYPPEYAGEYYSILSNLAAIYEKKGDGAKSLALRSEALDYLKKNNMTDSVEYAVGCINSGNANLSRCKPKEAEEYYREALKITEKLLGKTNAFYAAANQYLGRLFVRTGEYEKAEPFLKEAARISQTSTGTTTFEYANLLITSAIAQAAQGRQQDALKLLYGAADVEEKLLRQVLSISSEQQKMALLSKMKQNGTQDIILTISFENAADPKALSAALDLIIRRQGLVLESMVMERESAKLSRDPELSKICEELKKLRSEYSKAALAGPGDTPYKQYQDKVKAMEDKIDTLESSIAKKNASFKGALESRKATIGLVSQRLPDKSAFVQFVMFRPVIVKSKVGEPLWGDKEYAALVFKKGDSAPSLACLGKAKEIDAAINDHRAMIMLYTSQSDKAEALYAKVGAKLRKLLWDPLAKSLGDSKKIYLCPDSKINFVSFASLPLDNGKYLIEESGIVPVSVARDIFKESSGGASGLVVAFGDPDYDGKAAAKPAAPVVPPLAKPGYFGLQPCSALPGTKTEVENVEKLCKGANVECKTFMAAAATEEEMKKVNRPKMLYLATHGFFLPEGGFLIPDERFDALMKMYGIDTTAPGDDIKNPMLRSGLILAGVNRTLNGELSSGADDGVVTAEEVVEMSLDGTKLVVLSACETALGEDNGGEGVLGLKRAFVMAGAENLVMSLWPVADKETADLLSDFFEHYIKSGKADQSLREAQIAFIQKRREKKKCHSPFFWAAFISSGIGIDR